MIFSVLLGPRTNLKKNALGSTSLKRQNSVTCTSLLLIVYLSIYLFTLNFTMKWESKMQNLKIIYCWDKKVAPGFISDLKTRYLKKSRIITANVGGCIED